MDDDNYNLQYYLAYSGMSGDYLLQGWHSLEQLLNHVYQCLGSFQDAWLLHDFVPAALFYICLSRYLPRVAQAGTAIARRAFLLLLS